MAKKANRLGVRKDQVDVYGRPVASSFFEKLIRDLPSWTDLPSWKGGTEQLLPENDDEPETSPILCDIEYPDELREDQYFTYRQSPTTKDGLAKIRGIRGNTLVWNQLVSYSGLRLSNGITPSYLNGVITLSGTASQSYANIFPNIDVVNNDIYLCIYSVITNPNNLPIKVEINNKISVLGRGNGYVFLKGSETASGGAGLAGLTIDADYTGVSLYAYIIDLTKAFGVSAANYIYGLEVATAGAGVNFFRKLFYLSYYKPDSGSLLSFTGEGIKTVGFNQFNKNDVVLNKYISDNDGSEGSSSGAVASGWIPVIPNATYYISTEQTALTWGAFYDENKEFVKGINNYGASQPESSKIFIAPSNAHFARLTVKSSQTGNLDSFCFNISDTSRNGQYEPYISHETDLPTDTYFPTGMKSVGTVYDELLPDRAITRVGYIDLGTLTWERLLSSGTGNYYFKSTTSLTDGVGSLSTPFNGLIVGYTPVGSSSPSSADKQIALGVETKVLYMTDFAIETATAFKTAMSGVYLYYELAEPVVQATMSFD